MSDTAVVDETVDATDDPDETDADFEPVDDQDDDEPVNDPDPGSYGQEPSAQANAGDFEAKLKKLSQSAQTFRRRVSDVLGDDAVALVPCELCMPEIPGFHFDLSIMQPMDDTQARLISILKTPGAPEYVAAPDVRRCEACKGYGKGQTGSLVPGQETKVCTACAGFGFVPPPGSTTGAPDTSVIHTGNPDPGVQEDSDPWGSPRILPDGQINPNYGKMPQYKEASLP